MEIERNENEEQLEEALSRPYGPTIEFLGSIEGVSMVLGAEEQTPPAPLGEYAMSCLGRERIFQHFSRSRGTRTVTVRFPAERMAELANKKVRFSRCVPWSWIG